MTIGEGRRFNEIGAAILRVQLSKLSRIKEQMSNAKHALEEGMKATVSAERRKVVDPAGDLGSPASCWCWMRWKPSSEFGAMSGKKR